MAETTFLFMTQGGRGGEVAADLDVLILDCAISEKHSSEVQVTEHPVERGADISDHVRAKPESLTIEGYISNTPVRQADRPDGAKFGPPKSDDAPGFAKSAFDKLRTLKNAGTAMTIATALHQYEDMVIASLDVPRDATTGDGLRFSATFRQVNLVASQTVAVPQKNSPGAKKAKGGKKTAKTASAPVLKSFAAGAEDVGKAGIKKFKAGGLGAVFGAP